MKILILGSTGIVGTAITELCEKNNIDHFAATRKDIDIYNEGSIKHIIYQVKPTIIVNAIGLVGVNICENNPIDAINTNSIFVSHLANICQKLGITLIHPSTHNVFSGTKNGYYIETDNPQPIQVYGTTKYLSEQIVSKIPNYYIVRYPTLFGKRLNGKKLFPDKIIDYIKEGREFKISYDKIDSPSWSIDVANATLELAMQKYPYGVYHVANNGATNYYDFIQEIASILKIKPKVTKVLEKEFEINAPNALNTAMSSKKFPIIRTWQESLREYLNER